MKRFTVVLPRNRSLLAVGLLAILMAIVAPLTLLTAPASADNPTQTFGNIDCANLPTMHVLDIHETVDGNLTVSPNNNCTINGIVDGNIINNGSGAVFHNGSLNGNIELEGAGGSASGTGFINGNVVCNGVGTSSADDFDMEGNIDCP